MNKNIWSYKYYFITFVSNKKWDGHYEKKEFINEISFTTNLGKEYANDLAIQYINNYLYPKRAVETYYSSSNGRYMPYITYAGKTMDIRKERV
jgi:hypothetical protein